jgi:GTP-binding protein EngB required for normal cell division
MMNIDIIETELQILNKEYIKMNNDLLDIWNNIFVKYLENNDRPILNKLMVNDSDKFVSFMKKNNPTCILLINRIDKLNELIKSENVIN